LSWKTFDVNTKPVTWSRLLSLGVSLEVRRGEFVAIVGPSGSGKSTLMNLIGCLDRPSAGRVKIAGKDIAEMNDNQLTALRSKAIGFVFQQFQLLPLTSAVDNVASPLLYQGSALVTRGAEQRTCSLA
jgi:putative ABC transport system ATP-binding protein